MFLDTEDVKLVTIDGMAQNVVFVIQFFVVVLCCFLDSVSPSVFLFSQLQCLLFPFEFLPFFWVNKQALLVLEPNPQVPFSFCSARKEVEVFILVVLSLPHQVVVAESLVQSTLGPSLGSPDWLLGLLLAFLF